MNRFYYSSEFINQPIIFALENNLVPHEFQLTQVNQVKLSEIIEKGLFDVALITPLQYALVKTQLLIVRDIIISSANYGRNILLYFKESLKKIENIYIRESKESSYSQFIASVILNEYFEVKPNWLPVSDNEFENLQLQKYPLLLLTDDDAINAGQMYTNFIDLSEELILKTELPFIHQLLVVRKDLERNQLIEKAISNLKLSLEIGRRNLVKIAKSFAARNMASWDYYHDLFEKAIQYHPNQEVWLSLTNVLNYIFYYGKSNYVRDLKFF